MQNELKPCPFCGGEAKLSHEYTNCDYVKNAYYSIVTCINCCCQTNNDITRAEDNLAINDWNTRQLVDNWKPIEELTIEPVSIMLYIKSSTGHNVYLPAEILEVNDTGESFIATEGGVSKVENIKLIYTHYALLTPPKS